MQVESFSILREVRIAPRRTGGEGIRLGAVDRFAVLLDPRADALEKLERETV
jgi:hypothetical protein